VVVVLVGLSTAAGFASPRQVVKTHDPNKLAIFGTPWSDMTKTGDSYFTNEMLANVIVPRTRSSQNLAARTGANFGFKAALYS
jgi:hypothetical protein